MLCALGAALPCALACSGPPAVADGAVATGGAGLTAAGGVSASGGSSSGTGGTVTSSGGASPASGGASAGGSGNATGGATASGGSGSILDLPETECVVTVLGAELAAIETVGVITWSTNLEGLSTAEIQFGIDEGYGMVAPVDLEQADYRTLLLGMKQDSTYHYRVAVSDGTSVCFGADQTIDTGTLATEAPTVSAQAGVADGFMVLSRGDEALVLDRDGDVVWAMDMGGSVFSAHMSWDGRYLFGRDTGPFDAGDGGTFHRVAMDGTGLVTIDAPGGDHHDFTAIPEGIAYLAKSDAGECDQIYTASDELTDGTALVDIWEIFEFFPATGGGIGVGNELCHANRIHYFADGDFFTVSDRNKNAVAIFGSDGSPVRSIGKAPTGDWTSHIQAEGANTDWNVQHGHHLYADDKLLVFSNDSSGGSAMLHYTIDGDSAVLDWKYADAGASMTQGDVQHLPNGNFLVTASNNGVIHQLGPDQALLATYTFPAGQGGPGMGMGMGVGYVWFRPTLYGAPPAR